MKPAAFDYVRPASVDEALAAIAEHGKNAAVLAGGQSLVPRMSQRIEQPRVVVDIMRIAELQSLGGGGDWLEIGAGIRMSQAARSAGSALLTRALGHVGSVPVRNSGTVCGSIAYSDPSAELPAVLLALDGQVVVRSIRGERVIPADEYFAVARTARPADELITSIRMRKDPLRTAFLEVTPRMGSGFGEFPVVAVAGAADRGPDGRFTHVSLALTGVGDRPVRARDAEKLLVGATLSEAVIDAAADAASSAVSPVADIHAGSSYRHALVRALTRRVVRTLAA